jgi:class 3 adenylate cyclase/tetratricopeptide (TPR) repeat protein
MVQGGSRTYDDAVTQGGALGAERSTAIVLFTDMVGSTELRSRLGEDAADELRKGHDALAAGAVEANRGHVIKNLGDGIMATFTGASDAVGAAVAIQQAIGRRNRSKTAALELRIGISAGDVIFEGADCFGTPVIEAARLCGAAKGGQILASEMVRWLARSGEGTFTPIGNLELKGLPEPVAAVQVDWDLLAESLVPLPPFLTDIGRIFVGRDDELERLGQLWKEAMAGELRVALLAGEPGVGKTRLAAELAMRVRDDGATVLAGRCDEDLGVPYQPFVEALRHFVDHAPLVSGRLGRYGGELARLVPELSERVPGLPVPLRSDPETERYRLFDAVAAWLAVASAEEPLLLVLDDLQWAAKPTLLLLRHVVRAGGGRVLVLGTYRDTELTHDHPLVELVADLRRQRPGERLSLSGLDDLGVRAFVEQAAGATLDDDGLAVARAIYEETEGNPFFVREVLRHLAETGGVERRQGAWTTRLPAEQLAIPEGVRDVVGRRLSRLSDEANQALRIAAVVGPEFELGVVRAAGDLDEEALLAAVEEAAVARLVTEVSATRFRFAHALVRATLYESLTAARQVTLHRRAAEAIETIHQGSLDDHVTALAYHWAKASAPVTDATKAVEYARWAGDRALAQLAHDEAVGYYSSALGLLGAAGEGDPRRLELLISLGEAQARAGDPGFRETLLEAARLAQHRGDADALARAALASARGGLSIGGAIGVVDAERVEALEAALSTLPTGDSPIRPRLLAALGQALLYAGDRERRVRLSQEATEMARRLGDPATLAYVLLERFFTIVAPSTLNERLDDSAELLSLAEALGNPTMTAQALILHVRNNAEAGRFEEADHHLEAAERVVAELGQPILRWFVGHSRAVRVLLAGDLVEAERLIHANFELGQATGQSDATAFLTSHLFLLRFEQGRLEELERRVVDATANHPMFHACLALLLSESGRSDEARAVYERLATTDFVALPLDNAWMQAMPSCAVVAASLGDRRGASALYGLLAPYGDQFVFAYGGAWGAVAHYLGLLATTLDRFEEAEARFAVAAATHERVGAPAWLARTRCEWAAMLARRGEPGDAERARDLLDRALATARDLGLASVERRVVALLSAR